ncbi:MAG: radical SAM protein [Acidobacteriota bacterium]
MPVSRVSFSASPDAGIHTAGATLRRGRIAEEKAVHRERVLPFGVAQPRFLSELERMQRADREPAPGIDADPGGSTPIPPLDLRAAVRLLREPSPCPDELLDRARRLTDEVFGRSILLFAPCYLSSFCVNHCLYCGFRFPAGGKRRFLSPDEAMDQIRFLAGRGMRRILLVTGEYPRLVTAEYLAGIIARGRTLGLELSVEVAPGPTRFYRRLVRAGAEGVVCYQEVYDRREYALLHPRGPKSRFAFRLGALERAGAAGMKRLGLGVLLGMSADPVRQVVSLIAHVRFLARLFPAAHITVSLPRLRPAVASFEPAAVVDDETLLRFFCVLRLALPRAGLVLSTRESAGMRRRLLQAGITQMSAGSVTVPGGYGAPGDDLGQFAIADRRSIPEVVADLEARGYAVRWTLRSRSTRLCRGRDRG